MDGFALANMTLKGTPQAKASTANGSNYEKDRGTPCHGPSVFIYEIPKCTLLKE